MAKRGITIQQVEGLKATGKLQRLPIGGSRCLYLQVAAKAGRSGVPTKTWIFRFTPTPEEAKRSKKPIKKLSQLTGRNDVWLTLGHYPHMSISKAEDEAARLRDGRRRGLDPRDLLKPKPPSPPDVPVPKLTVNELLDMFEATMADLKESTRKEYLRVLRTKVREWVGEDGQVFGKRPAESVTGLNAASLLQACRTTAPRTSTIVAIKMQECWDYGMGLEVLPDKRNIWKNQVKPRIKKKDRYLKEPELVLLGERLRQCGELEELVIAYKLFLLTGMRHRNLAHARWDWIDLQKQMVLIPPDQHKTGHRTGMPLTVYLSDHAVALLKRLKGVNDADEEKEGSPWLYPHRDDKEAHRDDLGDPWERIRKGQAWSDVNIHDLRRTLASVLSTMRYKGYVGEILGHAVKTVTDIYTHTEPETLLGMLDEAASRIVGLLDGTTKPGSPIPGPAKMGRPGTSEPDSHEPLRGQGSPDG